MGDPFATALGVLLSAAGSVAATYTPGDTDEPLSIRVIWTQGTVDAGARSDRVVVDSNTFDVRRSDVLNPARNDMIEVADPVTGETLTFRINAAPVLDVEGVTWTCPTEPLQ